MSRLRIQFHGAILMEETAYQRWLKHPVEVTPRVLARMRRDHLEGLIVGEIGGLCPRCKQQTYAIRSVRWGGDYCSNLECDWSELATRMGR